MHVPLNALYPSIESAAVRAVEPVPTSPAPSYRVLYTRGDDLLSPAEYRSGFELSLQRSLMQRVTINDETLTVAYAASATAYACTEYSANVTAGIPLMVTDPAKNLLDGTPLTHFLTTAPNILYKTVIAMLVWGRAYLRKERNPAGWPTGLKWLNPVDVEEILDGNGVVLKYRVREGYASYREVAPKEIIHIPLFDPQPDGNGLSKFEVAWKALSIEQNLATYAAAFFVNSARPDGMLTFKRALSNEEYEEAKRNWKQFKGASNSHRTAVMPGEAVWTPVQTTPADVAMTELKSEQRADICAIFGVDPVLIGLKDVADPLSANSTYSATEVNHIRNVTLPRLKMIILTALNTQWAHRDFDRHNYYTLTVDEMAIPALAEANLVKSTTARELSGAHLLDYDEARKLFGYAPRPDYLKRDPAHSLSLFDASGISRNELRRYVGIEVNNLDPDYVKVGGVLLPAQRLLEIANANANRLLAPPASPFPMLNGSDTVISMPAPPLLPAPEEARAVGESLCIMLDFANHPDLLALQQRVKALYADAQVTWNAPDSFHVTLLYAPAVDALPLAQIRGLLPSLDVPALDLHVGSLRVFDNLGEYAIHFRIHQNAALKNFQRALYEACIGAGIQVSAYSVPESYIPHITIGYAVQKPQTFTFNSKIRVQPSALFASYGDDEQEIYRAPLTEALSTRSAMPLEITVSFAENQFLKQCRRQLSERLTEQGINAEWIPDSDYRYTLATIEDWTPNDAAAILRTFDFEDTRKIDITTDDFIQFGNTIYLQLLADHANTLHKAIRMELNGLGLKTDYVTVEGIALCHVTQDAGVEAIDIQPYPLVANNLVLRIGGSEYHRWSLRSISPVQLRELQNWEHVTRRKGSDHVFNTEALTGTVVEMAVRDMLEAGVSVDDTFVIGQAILRDEVIWRAYADTRAAFVEALTALIQQGFDSEINRRTFAAKMRVNLRRSGLVAFREGLTKGGYPSDEGLTPEMVSAFNGWLSEQSGYVTAFGQALIKEGFTTLDTQSRAEQWANKSLDTIYYTGLALAAPEKQCRWQRDPAKESCIHCLERDGQVKTMAEWMAIGLPHSETLACHGHFCGCSLEDAE